MNIAVIAASDRSGREFVEAALAAGHTVRAGIRSPASFGDRKGLVVVQCDATNMSQVADLLVGTDAVVSLLGHVKGSPADVQTCATATVLQAMVAAGVSRMVSLTGTGVRFPGDKISFVDRMLNYSITIIDPARVKDGIQHVEVLKNQSYVRQAPIIGNNSETT